MIVEYGSNPIKPQRGEIIVEIFFKKDEKLICFFFESVL